MPKSNRTLLAWLAALAMVLVVVTGCAGTQSTKQQSEANQAQQNQAAANKSTEPAAESEKPAEPPRRGCAACHVKTADKDYSLLAEAKGRAAGHPTTAPDGKAMNENTTVETCLQCHGAGANGRGTGAPLALRTIVHPAHMDSTTFTQKYTGNCFTCHDVDNTGTFVLLSQKVETNEKGVPKAVPIPGSVRPSENKAKSGT